jgi:hypothetical protein
MIINHKYFTQKVNPSLFYYYYFTSIKTILTDRKEFQNKKAKEKKKNKTKETIK